MAKALRVIDGNKVDETTRYLLAMIGDFRTVFADLPIEAFLNPSSDQISYTVAVVGFHLDNAQGDYISVDGLTKGFQEIVVSVESFYNGRPEKKKLQKAQFNLATMLAVLREYAPDCAISRHDDHDHYRYADRAFAALAALKVLTKGCTRDMHEPDNNGIEGYVLANYKNKVDHVQRPEPMVRIVKDDALSVDLYVDDLLYLMGSIRRV